MKLDIVTVVFNDEVGLLKLQARSISRYFHGASLNNIIILVNDDNPQKVIDRIKLEVLPDYDYCQAFSSRVVIIDGRREFPPNADADGWSSQQALKLRAASVVSVPFYLMLDAKNHLLHHIDYQTLVDGHGRTLTFVSKKYGAAARWCEASYATFDVDADAIPDRTLPTVTPFTMERDLVNSLVTDLESKFGAKIEDTLWRGRNRISEFFLYQAYIFAKHGSFDGKFWTGPKKNAALFTSWPEKEVDVLAELDFAAEPTTHTLGLHRNRIAQLTDHQLRVIVTLWANRGLITPGEDLSWILPDRVVPDVHIDPTAIGVRRKLGLQLLLDPSCVVDRYVTDRGQWEGEQLSLLLSAVDKVRENPKKKYFFDVGSFWGLYSLMMLKTEAFHQIYAFEADFTNFAQLQAQLFLNKVSIPNEITPLLSAVTHESGRVRFSRSEERKDGNRGAAKVLDAEDRKDFVEIDSIALDDKFDIKDAIIFIKIDVESHELNVIRGAKALFRSNTVFAQIEDWEKRPELQSLMAELGYRQIGTIGPDLFFVNSDIFEPEAATLEKAQT